MTGQRLLTYLYLASNLYTSPGRNHPAGFKNKNFVLYTMKKVGSLIKLPTFFIIEFILQDCEVCDFDKVNLASVLLLPALQY